MSLTIAPITAAQTYAIRKAILWPDGPEHMILLADDDLASSQHFGLFDGALHIGVISLFTQGDEMQFRKLAVLADYQGKGAGSALIRHTIDVARAQNITKLWCNARVNAAAFYSRFGFDFEPETFTKSGVDYQISYLTLS